MLGYVNVCACVSKLHSNPNNQTAYWVFAVCYPKVFHCHFVISSLFVLQASEHIQMSDPVLCATPVRNMEHMLSSSFSPSISSSPAAPVPSSLKARSGADQQSSSGSRSCPKKTILLPSSASSLSLHSEVTQLSAVSVCFVLSLSVSNLRQPHQVSHYPRSFRCSPKASYLMHFRFDLCSV